MQAAAPGPGPGPRGEGGGEGRAAVKQASLEGTAREEAEEREEEEEREAGRAAEEREEEGRAEVATPSRASSFKTWRPCDGVLSSTPTFVGRPRVGVRSGATGDRASGALGEPGRRKPAARMLSRSSLAVRGWRRAAPWAVREER